MHPAMITDDLNMLTWVSFRTWRPTISRIAFLPYGFMITYSYAFTQHYMYVAKSYNKLLHNWKISRAPIFKDIKVAILLNLKNFILEILSKAKNWYIYNYIAGLLS